MDYGEKSRPGGRRTARCDQMAEMVKGGKTFYEVAAHFDVSPPAVFYACVRRGYLQGPRIWPTAVQSA